MSLNGAIMLVGCLIGGGLIGAAVWLYWTGERRRPRSVGHPSEYTVSMVDAPSAADGVTVTGFILEDWEPGINERALRKMMKRTAAEMEETGEWWGYRWSK